MSPEKATLLADRGDYAAATAFNRAIVAVFPDVRDRSASASKAISSYRYTAGRTDEALKAPAEAPPKGGER